MKWLDWYGCYKTSSKPWLVPEAFSHPAKMSIGLCQRIFEFMEDKGMIHRGDVIVDPFGGIGTTALVGATKGYQVICVELEERFIRMSNKYECPGISKEEWLRWFNRFGKNIALCPSCQGKLQGAYEGNGVIPSKSAHLFVGNVEKHRELWERLNKPIPIVIQGDSRKLSEILGRADAAVMSPPYLATRGGEKGIIRDGYNGKLEKAAHRVGDRTYRKGEFSENSIDSLEEGSISAVLTSPPWQETGVADHKGQTDALKGGKLKDGGDGFLSKEYGNSPGQISSLKDPGIEAVITSPPYAESPTSSQNVGNTIKKNWGKGRSLVDDKESNYGATSGQIGSLKDKGIEAVITSPPFFDSTRFYLANWMRLWFAGWERSDFRLRPRRFLDERQKASFNVYESVLRQARERLRRGGLVVLHLGWSPKCDMASEIEKVASHWFRVVDRFSESVKHCESHGVRDKGTVHSHQYLILE